MPNDDRLFPGRLESQLGIDETADGEWAVDKILSHVGTRDKALFEIQWKAGDITWLPYEKISDLQALSAYFDLLGIDKVSDLPKGNGTPPHDDPQIYLGAIASDVSSSNHKILLIFRTISSFLSSLFSCCISDPNLSPNMSPYRSKKPKEQPRELEHLLLLYTTDGEFRCLPPLGDPSATPPINIYTKRIIAEYCSYSQRLTKNRVEALEDLRGRAPVGYTQFARYYSQYAPDKGKRFTLYNFTLDCFVEPDNPIAHSNFYLTEHPPSRSNTHSSKPYNKPNSLTSLLQQSHKLKGVDGLLADLLLTSTSAQASKAKQGTLHFGIHKSKRTNTAFGSRTSKLGKSRYSSASAIDPLKAD